MPETYDCIVLGVGGFGSSALFHLAQRGLRALGIEQFGVAHDRGSSHGETRIIRKAYFEHPDYVPLLLRAYELWRELEAETRTSLYHECGLMLSGPANGETIQGAQLAARLHGLRLERFELSEAARRFPGFQFAEDAAVLFEPEAGYLLVEDCVRAHIEAANRRGADLRIGETVVEWRATADCVQVRTDRGEYHAARMIVTAGPWAGRMLRESNLPLEVVRKLLFWHPVTTADYNRDSGGVAFFYETPAGEFYGFPSLDGRLLKLAEHSGGQTVADPLTVDQSLHPADVQPVANFLRAHLPGVSPEPSRHVVCMYTLSPDRHFIVDRHPKYPQIAFGAGFSGHGFKFTSSIGEALADLAMDGTTRQPIGFLGLGRPALAGK